MFSENHSTGYNSNNEGLEITISKAGKYSFQITSSGSQQNGISLNSSQLTTNISSINVQDRLAHEATTDNDAHSCTVSLYLDINDVIRAHGNGVAPSDSNQFNFTATYLGS